MVMWSLIGIRRTATTTAESPSWNTSSMADRYIVYAGMYALVSMFSVMLDDTKITGETSELSNRKSTTDDGVARVMLAVSEKLRISVMEDRVIRETEDVSRRVKESERDRRSNKCAESTEDRVNESVADEGMVMYEEGCCREKTMISSMFPVCCVPSVPP